MQFAEAVRGRRSIRSFEPRAIEDDKLTAILETVDAAPSAGNLQAYEVVVVKDANTRQALSRAALGQGQVARAPVVLVFLAHPLRSAPKYGSRGADLYSVQDATIACAYAQLAATDLGLSSCWIGAFAPEPVAEAVNAPKHLTPVAMLPLGYAAEEPGPTTRRGVRDIVTWETF